MEQMITYMRGLDWSPLIISLKTGVVATAFSFFLGIPLPENFALPYHSASITGHFGCSKSSESRAEDKSNRRWYSDTADGTSTDSRGLFSVIDL